MLEIEQTFLTFPSSRSPPNRSQDQVPSWHHPYDGSPVTGSDSGPIQHRGKQIQAHRSHSLQSEEAVHPAHPDARRIRPEHVEDLIHARQIHSGRQH